MIQHFDRAYDVFADEHPKPFGTDFHQDIGENGSDEKNFASGNTYDHWQPIKDWQID